MFQTWSLHCRSSEFHNVCILRNNEPLNAHKTLKKKVPHMIISDLQRTSSHAPTLSFLETMLQHYLTVNPPPPPMIFFCIFLLLLFEQMSLPPAYINAKSAAQSVPSSKWLQTLMYITSSGKFVVFGPTIVMNGFMKEGAPWPCSPLSATFPLYLGFLSTVFCCLVINWNLKYNKNMKYHAEQWSKGHEPIF